MRLIVDTESDGFVADATKIHCIVTIDVDTGQKYLFYGDTTVPGDHGSLQCGIDYLMKADELIGHNIIPHDLPLIKKLYGVEYIGIKTDTLVMSRALNCDRRLPPDCPGSILNPKTGKKDRIGPHSLAAWGYRVGRGKPEHFDWDEFSLEMLHRCAEDTEINLLTYFELLDELGSREIPKWLRMEFQVSHICAEIERNGWLVDRDLIVKHIETLNNLLKEIEDKVYPRIPAKAVPKESKTHQEVPNTNGETVDINWIKKPFLKSGQWSKSVRNWIPEHWNYVDPDHVEVAGTVFNWSVGGPFTRIEFEKISLTSDKQVKQYLLSIGWVPTEWNFSKKTQKVTSPKLTEESFDSLQNDTGKLIAQHIKACHRRSQLQGWLDNIRPDGRVPMIINPQGTPTGRASHSVIVNVPSEDKAPFFAKEMRSVFIAKPGYILVGCDSMSDQIRKLCHYMGDEEFTYAVIHGKKEDSTDMHSLNMRKANLPSRGHAKNFFYGCVSLDTLALTRMGWKKFNDVEVGELVLTYNQQKNIKEWKPVLEKYYYPEADLIELSHSKGFCVQVTPDHRWFVNQRQTSESGKSFKRPYTISQVRTTKELNQFSNIITNAPMEPDSETSYKFLNDKYNTDWTKEVLNMCSEERKAFLQGFLLADGYTSKHKSWRWSQNRGNISEGLLLASYLEHDGFIHVQDKPGYNEKMIGVTFSKKQHTTGAYLKKKELGKHPVWCIKTENESFVIRYKNCITITGNSIMFGAGDLKTGKLLQIQGDDNYKKKIGKEKKQEYFRQLPKFKQLLDGITAAYKRRGYLIGLDGRPLRPRKDNDLMAYLIQGAEAIMMKLALCYLYSWLKEENFDARIVSWYHDEYAVECLPEDAERIAFLSEEAIRQAGRDLELTVPSDGDASVGHSWYDIH